MLLEDNKDVTLAGYRFTLAIVLSNLGDNNSARVVLNNFIGDEECKDGNDWVTCLTKILNEKRSNSFIGMLRYFWENPVFSTTDNRHNTINKKSLKELTIPSISFESLYYNCVSVFIDQPINMLIYLYAKTPLFREEFLKDFRRKINNHTFDIKRKITSAEIDQIGENVLVEFWDQTFRFYATGNYDVRSLTPDKYLFNALNNFFDKGIYYREIDTVGLNKSILKSEDSSGVTSMDLASVNVNISNAEFDFISAASRIYQASAVLFSYHNNSSIYYDLVSWYKTKSINSILDKNKSVFKKLKEDKVDVEVTAGKFDIITTGNSITQNNKFNARLKICDGFACMLDLDNLIPPVHVLYEDILRINEGLTDKDGAKVFSSATHTVKGNLSNGQTFKKIYDGFYALRRLLIYLRERTDIDIYSIPSKIFQDYKLIRRFSSLDDYLERHKLVEEVMDEEMSDPSVSTASVESGIYSNDDLYDCYSLGGYASSNRIIDYIIHLPVINIKDAIESECRRQIETAYGDNVEAEAENVCENVKDSDGFIQVLISGAVQTSENPTDKVLTQFCSMSINAAKDFENKTFSIGDLFVVFTAVKYLGMYLEHLGHPLVNDAGQYTAFNVNSDQLFSFIESEEIRKYCNAILHIADSVICNKDIDLEETISWTRVHAIFIAVSATLLYTDKIRGILVELNGIRNDNNVLLIRASKYISALNLSEVAFSRRDLQLLVNSKWENYQLSAKVPRDQFLHSISVDNQYIVRAYNLAMSYLHSTVKLFQDILLGISETFVDASQTESVSDLYSNTLSEASGLLYGTKKVNKEISTMLEIYETDDLGFLKHGNKRIHNDTTYFHKYGYSVTINNISNDYKVSLMTESDVNKLKVYFDYGYFV